MLGLAERSIVMSHNEAKEYVQIKIERLYDEIYILEDKLKSLQTELEYETKKLEVLDNPPELY